jgi:hypothetical protein
VLFVDCRVLLRGVLYVVGVFLGCNGTVIWLCLIAIDACLTWQRQACKMIDQKQRIHIDHILSGRKVFDTH